MMVPIAICCQFEFTPITTNPLVTTCKSRTPTTPAAIVPDPPNRLTPPTTTPAITSNSQPLPIDVGALLRTLNASWQIVRTEAGLKDVRLHDLRHGFASRALALGESLPMIGKLLGHTQVQTTARYAHLGRNSVKIAAVRISDSLEADMNTPPDVAAAP